MKDSILDILNECGEDIFEHFNDNDALLIIVTGNENDDALDFAYKHCGSYMANLGTLEEWLMGQIRTADSFPWSREVHAMTEAINRLKEAECSTTTILCSAYNHDEDDKRTTRYWVMGQGNLLAQKAAGRRVREILDTGGIQEVSE